MQTRASHLIVFQRFLVVPYSIKMILIFSLSSMSKHLLLALVGIVVVGGGSFYGGMTYGKSSAVSAQTAMDAARGGRFRGMGGGNGGGRMGGGFLGGDVIAKDATSLTIKLRDGGSKIIFYSSSTQMHKQATGTIDEIAIGKQIMVTGDTNTDGSVTASSIQLR